MEVGCFAFDKPASAICRAGSPTLVARANLVAIQGDIVLARRIVPGPIRTLKYSLVPSSGDNRLRLRSTRGERCAGLGAHMTPVRMCRFRSSRSEHRWLSSGVILRFFRDTALRLFLRERRRVLWLRPGVRSQQRQKRSSPSGQMRRPPRRPNPYGRD